MSASDARTEAVMWRRLDRPGMEQCRLSEHETGGASLQGRLVLSQGAPFWIEYEVHCDRAWRTRQVAVRAHRGAERREMALEADEGGNWRVGGKARPDLQRCLDVDLGFTPSTNTLPIRRLRLNAGESATIDAAWVEFPSLEVHRATQRYARIAERTYRYEHPSTGFVALIDVDSEGLVTAYPPGWERVDESSHTSGPLFSPSASSELGGAAAVYSDLMGSWDVEVIDYDEDGTRRTTAGEWHFGWALEGRAVQDVFIVPRRGERPESSGSRRGNRYGTTLRFFDPAQKAWRIAWINPVSGAFNTLVARKEGGAIVQEGEDPDGRKTRWTFDEIERDRFHWVGEESRDGGATWKKHVEFFARRTSFLPLR